MFIRLLKKVRLFKFLNFKFNRYINNVRFVIPIINGIGEGNLYSNEEWKIPLIDKLTKLKKGIFIDVGVNIGHTLLKLRSVNADYKYIGFEPNVSCVNYLKQLILVNGLKNIHIIPVALGIKNELLELNYHYGGDEEGASLIPDFRPNQPVIHKDFVPVFNCDTVGHLFNEPVSIIKVDVEGFELDVIKGLSAVIDKNKPYIICEILPVYSSENRSRIDRQDELLKILKQREYSIFRILNNGSLFQLNEIEIHSDMSLTYYLFVHKGDTANLLSAFN